MTNQRCCRACGRVAGVYVTQEGIAVLVCERCDRETKESRHTKEWSEDS